MSMIPFNKTKIVATIGPASNSKAVLKSLIQSGTDVFRLNFSHGSYADHQKVIDNIRQLNEELGTTVSMLQDLQGPKIRVNEVAEDVVLKSGNEFIITTEEVLGNEKRASTSYKGIIHDVKGGDMVLIDDGKIELKIKEVQGGDVICEVVHGGTLRSRKGINLPQSNVSAPSMTEKDYEDLQFGIKNNMDWIALSFVRSAADILELRSIIEKSQKEIRIIAKIEKPQAVENIDEIIEVTDAVMVARGDLGVEILLEEVPIVQKKIVQKCIKAAKPVIIATQMMESMIENPRPTRAETNDVANAVLDGADALMLSGETAVGAFPSEVIKSMVRTISSVERQSEKIYFQDHTPASDSPLFYNDTVIHTASQLAKTSNAKAITGMTQKGYTAFKISSHRPKAHIFIFSENRIFLNAMNLIWGVRGIFYNKATSTDETMKDIGNILKEKGYIEKGDVFISTASMPIKEKGRANMVKINYVD
ncbi:MAG: pyruvate kinase [Cyclobacteriaceae bacterium]|nr:pyruvate kinase [Cyclobacteriaceae bacterium]